MTAIYICDESPSLAIKINGTRRKFVHKKLELTDERDIAFMDRLIADPEKTHIRRLVRKLDFAAAEKIAHDYAEKHLKPVASKGSVTSEVERAQLRGMEDQLLGENLDMRDPDVRKAVEDILQGDDNVTLLERTNTEENTNGPNVTNPQTQTEDKTEKTEQTPGTENKQPAAGEVEPSKGPFHFGNK